MSRTERTAVDEANTNQANMVPRREQNGLNIQELESDITASGKVTAEDLELLAVLKRADSDKNGVVSAREAMAIFRDDAKSHLDLKKSRRMVALLFLLLLLLLLSMTGLVALVTAMYKDAYVKGDTSTRPTMSNADDQVVGVRAATHNLPLLVAPVLPDDELFSVETIRVTLPASTDDSAGPAEGGSGEAINETTINEVTPGVVNAFRISRVEKVNSTAVVFHALGGEQIRVWNGETTVRLAAIGPEIPVCSANVTCAAFQVKGAELAEKYLAEAEALLAPFEGGRRRLVTKCIDPFTWWQRDVAQKQACTNPTTSEGCEILATQMGLFPLGSEGLYAKYPEHRVGNWATKGCFMLKPDATNEEIKQKCKDYVGNIDCLKTGGQNGRDTVFFGTGGTDAQMNTDLDSIVIRLPVVDPACLALSNQAKLELNLNMIGRMVSWIQSKVHRIAPVGPTFPAAYPVDLNARYCPGGFDLTRRTWEDCSGNGNTATLSGSGLSRRADSGHGAKKAVTALFGTRSSVISFGPVIKSEFTICSVTRYTGDAKLRILNGGGKNWLHGHNRGHAGVAYYEGWKTAERDNVHPDTNWVVMCGSNAGAQIKIANRVHVGTAEGGSGDVSLFVNGGWWFNEKSDFAIAEVVVWPRGLTGEEMRGASNYLFNQYLG